MLYLKNLGLEILNRVRNVINNLKRATVNKKWKIKLHEKNIQIHTDWEKESDFFSASSGSRFSRYSALDDFLFRGVGVFT